MFKEWQEWVQRFELVRNRGISVRESELYPDGVLLHWETVRQTGNPPSEYHAESWGDIERIAGAVDLCRQNGFELGRVDDRWYIMRADDHEDSLYAPEHVICAYDVDRWARGFISAVKFLHKS